MFHQHMHAEHDHRSLAHIIKYVSVDTNVSLTYIHQTLQPTYRQYVYFARNMFISSATIFSGANVNLFRLFDEETFLAALTIYKIQVLCEHEMTSSLY